MVLWWLRTTIPQMYVSFLSQPQKAIYISCLGHLSFLLVKQRFLFRHAFISAEGMIPSEHGYIMAIKHDHCYLIFSCLKTQIWKWNLMCLFHLGVDSQFVLAQAHPHSSYFSTSSSERTRESIF